MISSNSETNILFMGLESVQCTPSDEKSRWLTIDRFAAAFCKQIGPPTKPLQDFPRNHSVSPGKPPLPRYTSAARRVNTAARLDSRARHSYRGILFDSGETWLSARDNKRYSRAHKHHTCPADGANLFAQNIFRSEGADHVAQRRGGNHKAHRLPRQQNQQGIKRKGHQRDACPEPRVPQRPAEKSQNVFRT